jgi:hypothetical protein
MRDMEGRIIGISGTTRDIHARKIAEMKVQEQMDELRRWNTVTLGRENRILELKQEVNQLLDRLGEKQKYSGGAPWRITMAGESFLGLVHNISLLLALVLIFDIASQNWRSGNKYLRDLLIGVIVGGVGLAIMLTPWVFIPGIIFDTRSVLLGFSGIFFGTIPTLIAMAMTISLRIYQGGTGAIMGVSVILATEP